VPEDEAVLVVPPWSDDPVAVPPLPAVLEELELAFEPPLDPAAAEELLEPVLPPESTAELVAPPLALPPPELPQAVIAPAIMAKSQILLTSRSLLIGALLA
jgi:hypothetical protein